MWVAKSGPVGGVMKLPEDAKAMGAPPHWLPYINTPDVDATVRQANQLGAKTLFGPHDIPNVGRFAVLQDPQGAVFATFKASGSPMPMSDKPGIGEFSWHELVTTDWNAAFRFYQQLFGWEKTESMDMGPEMGIYQMYGWKGNTLGGMMNRPKEMQAPPNWLSYIRVADSKQATDTFKRLGGTLLNGPMEVPGGDWISQGLDPQGAAFAVHSVTAKPVATATPSATAAKPSTTAAKPSSTAAKPAATTAKPAAKAPAKKAKAAKPARKAAKKTASKSKAKSAKPKKAKKAKKSKRR
jgi:predicted enzyme related to lactoylglutathione lyase